MSNASTRKSYRCRHRRMIRSALCSAIFVAVMGAPTTLWAQETSGSVSGSIVGGVPANAQVLIRNLGDGSVVTRQPDASGGYRGDGLAPGNYEISLTSAGSQISSTRVQVHAAATASADLPGATSSTTVAKQDVSQELDAILVTGIRGSMASANDKKRESPQILDAIVSEDVGKLPDNNVPEALSRVTGVQIDRVHGEGSGVSIRGLTDIQTTINGNSSSVGESRSTNLADIPAELLKSVEVYKTRTANQVEGGIAGTVNVELRRPLDLPKGDTFAASLRGVYSDIGEDWSPYGSVLWGKHFDTGLGEMGFLLNGSFTRNNYEEVFIDSESPSNFAGDARDNLPAGLQDIIAPYAMNYGVEKGQIERPSLNAAFQWKATDNLDFVLEGSYFGSEEKRQRDRLHLVLRETNYDLSDIVLAPDGKTVQSVTASRDSGLTGGPESYYEELDSDNYTTNFEAHWNGEAVKIKGSAQYNWSKTNQFGIQQIMRLKDVTSATVDTQSPNVPGGGPYIDFVGADLANVDDYTLYQFHDEQIFAKSHEFATQLDLTYTPRGDGFVRSIDAGLRYSRRNIQRRYGYRDVFPEDADGDAVALTDFPAGELVTTQPNLDGAAYTPSWYHLSGQNLMSNYATVIDYLSQFSEDWTTTRPSANRGGSFVSNEKTYAGYAQLNYGFELGVPIDGVAGVRVTRTEGVIDSANYRPDTNGGPDIIQAAVGEGSYTDVLPSITGIAHLTDKLQLRLAYTQNVERPSFYELRPYAYYETRASPPLVYSGNPDLKPNREESYDMSLEYYFGKAGSMSFAAFLKKPDGFLYNSGEEEYVPELGTNAIVYKMRNAGPGEFRGYEFAVQSFFDFLPGLWSNFGASANFTYMDKFQILYPFSEEESTIPGIYDAVGTSKQTMNLALYYDTPKFSVRLAYNRRSKRKDWVWTEQPAYSPYTMETSRLDAAINYTPYKFVTFSLEATNLLDEDVVRYFGTTKYLPQGPRYEARTVQLGVRMRW